MRVLLMSVVLVAILATPTWAWEETGGTVSGGPEEQQTTESMAPVATPQAEQPTPSQIVRQQITKVFPTRQITRRVTQRVSGQSVEHEVGSWDPASVSFVEARDGKTYRLAVRDANRHSDAKIDGFAKGLAAHDSSGSWPNLWPMLWWIVLPILAILALFALLGHLFGWGWGGNAVVINNNNGDVTSGGTIAPLPRPSMWSRWRNRPRRCPRLIRNTAGGEAFGRTQDDSVIDVTHDGNTCVSIHKGVSFHASGHWDWAYAGQRLTTLPAMIGTPIRFQVVVHNKAVMPIRTNTIVVRDLFRNVGQPRMPYIVTSGSIWIRNRKLRDLRPDELEGLVEGNEIHLAKYIDKLNASENFSFLYTAEITGNPVSGQTADGCEPTVSEFKRDELDSAPSSPVAAGPSAPPVHDPSAAPDGPEARAATADEVSAAFNDI